jgi:hypothetical protein
MTNISQLLIEEAMTGDTDLLDLLLEAYPIHMSHAVRDMVPGFDYDKKQLKLHHGIDFRHLETGGDKLRRGITSRFGVSAKTKNAQGKWVIVKQHGTHQNLQPRLMDWTPDNLENLTTAKREGVFANLANRFFGLGKYVPTTSIIQRPSHQGSFFPHKESSPHGVRQYSVMQFTGGVPMANARGQDVERDSALANGDLHKLAIMDIVLGNYDRHAENVFLRRKANKNTDLRLIDHGLAFNYRSATSHFTRPSYLGLTVGRYGEAVGSQNLHPNAHKWLLSLDPKKFMNHLTRNNVASGVKYDALTRLHTAQEHARATPTIGIKDLLDHITYSHERKPMPSSDKPYAPPTAHGEDLVRLGGVGARERGMEARARRGLPSSLGEPSVFSKAPRRVGRKIRKPRAGVAKPQQGSSMAPAAATSRPTYKLPAKQKGAMIDPSREDWLLRGGERWGSAPAAQRGAWAFRERKRPAMRPGDTWQTGPSGPSMRTVTVPTEHRLGKKFKRHRIAVPAYNPDTPATPWSRKPLADLIAAQKKAKREKG